MGQSDFLRSIASAKDRLRRAEIELIRTKELALQNDMAGAFGTAFAFEAEVEKLALLARSIPAYTGHPLAQEKMDAVLQAAFPIEMGYTQEGWFCLRIPALLPKKGNGSPVYIQQVLYPAMGRFFQGKVPASYSDCVLIYRHVYDSTRPERAWRDHDNIEQNMVTDIITLYLLPDDAPARCAHFYCSAAGPADCTEVYVVPLEQFSSWIYAAFHDGLKEVTLYENRV